MIKKEWLDMPAKTYKVPLVGNCISNYIYVKAPNKTMARLIAGGSVNAGIRVKGKIQEVADKE